MTASSDLSGGSGGDGADRAPSGVRGRRPGHADTRGSILEAARRTFAERGYEGATVRGIARAAGVDPALVHHYFGGKEQVFVAAMALPFDPAVALSELLAGGRAEVGERFVRFLLGVWSEESTREPFLGLLRSAMTNEAAAAMLREFVGRALLARVAAELDVDDPELRAAVAASHMVGLALLRYVVRVEPLASADEETVVALVAPAISGYLTGSAEPRP